MSKPVQDSQLFTDRLLLKPLSPADTEFIYRLVNTEGWLKFIGDRNVHSREDASAYVQKILQNPAVRYWTVHVQNSSHRIGIVTYIKRDYLDHPDLGFAFLPEFSGNGYAFEAAKTLLHFVMRNGGQQTILATTLPANMSSIRLLTKLGFRFQKEVIVGSDAVHVYGVSADFLNASGETMAEASAR